MANLLIKKIFILSFVFYAFMSYSNEIRQLNIPICKDDFSNYYATNMVIEYKSNLHKKIDLYSALKYKTENDAKLYAFQVLIMSLINNTPENIKPFIVKQQNETISFDKSFLLSQKVFQYMQKQTTNVYLLDRIIAENREFFIFGGERKDKKGYNIICEEFIKQDGKIVWNYNVNNQNIINTIVQIMRINGGLFEKQRNVYQYSLPLIDSSKDTYAKLLFNGHNYIKNPNHNDQFHKLYYNVALALKSKPIQKSMPYFTQQSGKVLKEQVKKYPFMKVELGKQKKERILAFRIEAKPFYIVFSKTNLGVAKYIDNFDYIYKRHDNEVKFTNYANMDYFFFLLQENLKNIEKLIR